MCAYTVDKLQYTPQQTLRGLSCDRNIICNVLSDVNLSTYIVMVATA